MGRHGSIAPTVPTIRTVWNLRDVSSRMPVQGALKCQAYRGFAHFKLGWHSGMASYDLAALPRFSALFGFADTQQTKWRMHSQNT